MTKIWKYELKKEMYQEIELPENSKILTAQIQYETPCIWIEVDPLAKKTVSRKFVFVATGEEVLPQSKYIATLQFNGGKVIQHLYELVDIMQVREIKIQHRNENKSDFWDKIKGTVYGHAIGDAIGLGTEFMDKEQIKYYYPKGYTDFNQIIDDKHRLRWKKGEWTDDTDQMLCILESLINKEYVDELDIAKRIHSWAYNGGRGLGNTVYNVISSPRFLIEPHEVARLVWLNSGKNMAANGAIMRTSILGIWEFAQFEKLRQNTENIAKITHFDPRCVGSCVAVTYAISKLLQNDTDIDKITSQAIELTDEYDVRIREYLEFSQEKGLDKLRLDEPESIGYTLKAMSTGFWALHQNNFKTAILEIVNQGGDADTNAAVAGSILGAKLGYKALPKEWIDGLQNKVKLNHLIDKLLALMIKTGQIE